MPETSSIALFALAAFVLVAIPGPSVLYIITRGATQGPRAGLVSAAGIQTGSLVHVAAAVCGLSAIITTSATAFTIVKVLGGTYLIFLGVRAWRAANHGTSANTQIPTRSLGRIYRDGIVVNALNPKTAVFFLAFLPQFVKPERGSVTLQLLVLGMVFVTVGLMSDGTYGLASGYLGDRIRRRSERASGRRSGRVAGALYVGLGALTFTTGSHA